MDHSAVGSAFGAVVAKKAYATKLVIVHEVKTPDIHAEAGRSASLTGSDCGSISQEGKDMPQPNYFDPAERQMEKERSRVADEAALAQGEISRGQLAEENGFFSCLDIVESSIGDQDFVLGTRGFYHPR